MITTESEFLEAMADVIEKRGWTQDRLVDTKTGAICLIGGMQAVLASRTNAVVDWGLSTRVQYRLHRAVGLLGRWNDELDRTKQEVLDLLRRLAKEARQEEEASA